MFRNQAEAASYALNISDNRERVFVQAALAHAIGLLAKDARYRAERDVLPFDLLRFVEALSVLVQKHDLVEVILSGRYSQFEEIPDQF